MLTRSLTVFNTSYFDLTLLSTTGTDDVVGATRTFSITADNSITLTEEVRNLYPVAMVLRSCSRLIRSILAYPIYSQVRWFFRTAIQTGY